FSITFMILLYNCASKVVCTTAQHGSNSPISACSASCSEDIIRHLPSVQPAEPTTSGCPLSPMRITVLPFSPPAEIISCIFLTKGQVASMYSYPSCSMRLKSALLSPWERIISVFPGGHSSGEKTVVTPHSANLSSTDLLCISSPSTQAFAPCSRAISTAF